MPAATLRRYRIGQALVMEERSEGIMLRPTGPSSEKLSWEDTAREMAAAGESWSEWDAVVADGLDEIPWDAAETPRVAERKAQYRTVFPSAFGREKMKRYEIRWANLDPAQGAEMAKSRPVVIVSLDALNERLQTVTVCPLTTQVHPSWRSRLQVRLGSRDAEVAVDQIRTISKSRLRAKISSLSDDKAAALRRIITEMYGE